MGNDLAGAAARLVDRLRAVTDPGPALRVHGDYHLGQVMRTDTGWYVLDFEGEPARPVEERTEPASPPRTSPGCSARSTMPPASPRASDSEIEQPGSGGAGRAWEDHNREAFTRGVPHRSKASTPCCRGAHDEVLAAYELDKALYELDYERAYRPDWVRHPHSRP